MLKKIANRWQTLSALLVLAGTMALTGCEVVYTGGGYYYPPSGGGTYYGAWYDVYGNDCMTYSPGPGCNFYWDGSKIQAHEDPYYYNSYNMQYSRWSYTDTYGYYQTYTGYAWLSPNGILYDEWGYALNEAEGQESRDLIGDVATQEKRVVERAGKSFAAKYSLSEATGVNIARTLNDWATLSKKQKRSRTAQDVADFAKRLYGVSVDQALAAMESAKKGDLSAVENLNADVASYWGTTPETSKAILKSWYKTELSDMGLHQ